MSRAFEYELRAKCDGIFERPVGPDNVIANLIAGEMSRDEVRDLFVGMWGGLMIFNQVLLPCLLRLAPTVEERVEVVKVIAPEYGYAGVSQAHPTLFHNLLGAFGVNVDPEAMRRAASTPQAQAEAEYVRSLSWCELLARILVGETLGPKVFESVASALRRHYGCSEADVVYFTLHAFHDKRDCEVLFKLVGQAAQRDLDCSRTSANVHAVIDRSFSSGRHGLYAGKVGEPSGYSFVAMFDGENES